MSMTFDLVYYVSEFCKKHALGIGATVELLHSIFNAIEWDWDEAEINGMVEREWLPR